MKVRVGTKKRKFQVEGPPCAKTLLSMVIMSMPQEFKNAQITGELRRSHRVTGWGEWHKQEAGAGPEGPVF